MGFGRKIRKRNRPPQKSDIFAAALISACLLPGGGQIYNGQKIKGIIIAVVVLFNKLFLLIELGVRLILEMQATMKIAEGVLPADTNPGQVLLNMLGPRLVIMLSLAVSFYIYGVVDAGLVASQQYREATRNAAAKNADEIA